MDRKIRILQCTAVLDMGGIENMIMSLYRNIDRESFAYDFVTGGGKEHYYYEDEIAALGGHVYRVPKRSISFIRHHTEFYKAVKNGNYDVLHFHSTNAYFTALEVLMARLAGVRAIIVHSHSTSDWRQKEKKHIILNHVAYIMLNALTAKRISCSKPAARWLFGGEKGVEIFPLPVKTIQYRYDKSKREQLRAEYGVSRKRVYAHAGRFSEEKNHVFLIECFRLIAEADKDAVLFLMGDGPTKSQIEAMVRYIGLDDKVTFFGNVNDMGNKLMAADIFVLPSKYEGFPTVVLEAQAAGLKCFVSDRVTDEICTTELVKQLPLEAGAGSWARELAAASLPDEEAKLHANDIIRERYDVETVAQKLEDMYRALSGRTT